MAHTIYDSNHLQYLLLAGNVLKAKATITINPEIQYNNDNNVNKNVRLLLSSLSISSCSKFVTRH